MFITFMILQQLTFDVGRKYTSAGSGFQVVLCDNDDNDTVSVIAILDTVYR